MNIILNLLKKQILKLVEQEFTVENVQKAISSVSNYLTAQAATTETKIDDWVVQSLNVIAVNTDLAGLIVDLVNNSLIQVNSEGKVLSFDQSPYESILEIAEKLSVNVHCDNDNCFAVPTASFALLIQVITIALQAWATLRNINE